MPSFYSQTSEPQGREVSNPRSSRQKQHQEWKPVCQILYPICCSPHKSFLFPGTTNHYENGDDRFDPLRDTTGQLGLHTSFTGTEADNCLGAQSSCCIIQDDGKDATKDGHVLSPSRTRLTAQDGSSAPCRGYLVT